jgi:hypothetical protein
VPVNARRGVGTAAPVRTYDLIADLPVRIDDYALEGLDLERLHAAHDGHPPARQR